MNLSRIGYIVAVLVVCVSGYYLLEKGQEYDIQVEPNKELPMFSGVDLVNTSFNEDGIRSYVITSVELDHYALSGDTIFDSPVLKVYREAQLKSGKLPQNTAS